MIYGVGNALMDITARVSEEFLRAHGVEKGVMTLAGLGRTEDLLEALSAAGIAPTISAGGSVSNSIAGIAALGGVDTALFCRVGDDHMGRWFLEETAALETEFLLDRAVGRTGGTSRSVILVTPDGERSMTTYLGASADLGPENLDLDLARSAKIGFIEGYLFDTAPGRAAAEALIGAGQVALTLSDPNCVRRNRDAFLSAIARAAIVFGNAKEMAALSGTTTEEGARICADLGAVTISTRSALPTLVQIGNTRHEVPVERVSDVLDTTGAGDQFAAGYLHAVLTGHNEVEAAVAGARAAARIIQQVGARPARNAEEPGPE